MTELKFYGLGGQGIVTAAKILAQAASLIEEKYAITIPAYGHERRGAPVNTSIIIDDVPVLQNSFVYEPDIVMVLDHTVADKGVDVAAGIGDDTLLVLNAQDDSQVRTYRDMGFKTVYYADATSAAIDCIGLSIPNSAMLGVLARTGIVSVESIEKAIFSMFGKEAGEKNAKAARRAYDETRKT